MSLPEADAPCHSRGIHGCRDPQRFFTAHAAIDPQVAYRCASWGSVGLEIAGDSLAFVLADSQADGREGAGRSMNQARER